MQVSERVYGDEKLKIVEKVESLSKKYSFILASSLYKVRAPQLMALRRSFRGQMEVLAVKNSLATLGLKRSGLKRVEELISQLKGQNVLIFANIDPFKLYLTLEKSKVNLPARAGDTATDDITIPSGNTGLPPGPVLSEFKEAGVATRIDSGSIFAAKDTVVAERGDVISPKLASLLSKLGLKPIRAGLSISFAYYNGLLLSEADVRVDLDALRKEVLDAFHSALTLAIEAAYPTSEAIGQLIVKGFREAEALALSSSYMTKENAARLLGRAYANASLLYQVVKEKGYQ